MKIGVLALQGAFREHLDTLRAIGVEGVRVREAADLDGVSGLILPGGESTTMRHLIERWGLRGPIMELAEAGTPIFGTCAGMIVPGRPDRRRRAADPAAARRLGGAQRLRAPARLVRGRASGPDPRRHAGPRGVHPRAGDRAGRPRRRRSRPPRRRPRGRRPPGQRHRDGLPPRARRARPASIGSWPRWPPSTTTRARDPAGAPIPRAAPGSLGERSRAPRAAAARSGPRA